MTKEELIKEAWSNQCLDQVDKKGWLEVGYCVNGFDDIEYWLANNFFKRDLSKWEISCSELDNGELVNVKIRPKSLQGIEDNNGWISLSGEPNEIEWVENLELYNIKTKEHYFCTDEHEFIEIGRFTHYKPIVKSKPPLY